MVCSKRKAQFYFNPWDFDLTGWVHEVSRNSDAEKTALEKNSAPTEGAEFILILFGLKTKPDRLWQKRCREKHIRFRSDRSLLFRARSNRLRVLLGFHHVRIAPIGVAVGNHHVEHPLMPLFLGSIMLLVAERQHVLFEPSKPAFTLLRPI